MSLLRVAALGPVYFASFKACGWTGLVLVFCADVLSYIVTQCDSAHTMRGSDD